MGRWWSKDICHVCADASDFRLDIPERSEISWCRQCLFVFVNRRCTDDEHYWTANAGGVTQKRCDCGSMK